MCIHSLRPKPPLVPPPTFPPLLVKDYLFCFLISSVCLNEPHAPSLHVFHFASIWMLGNLPKVEISEQTKGIINNIQIWLIIGVFSFVFLQESGTKAKMLI